MRETPPTRKELPDGYKAVGVNLPPSVIAIIQAAGGAQDFPRAMASIIGALPWIGVALSESLPPDEYRAILKQMRNEIEGAWTILTAKHVRSAFDAAFNAARKEIN